MPEHPEVSRFVVVGEALIDLSAVDDDLSWPAETTWLATSAGGPFNSAVALARLGAPVAFAGRLSTDAFGAQLREHLSRNEVALDLLAEGEEPTSLAVVSLDEAGKATYAFHFENTANFTRAVGEFPELTASDWVHTGSLACLVEPGRSATLEWLATTPAGVSLDINVRETVVGDPHEYWRLLEPWLIATGQREHGILKASDDDLAFLAPAVGGPSEPAELMAQWVERYGVGLGLVTLGPDGATAVRPGTEAVTVGGHRVEVVDTIAAGDTFSAGFLDEWRADPDDVEAALRRGVAGAAVVCMRRGAQPPTRAEVDEFLSAAAAGEAGRDE